MSEIMTEKFVRLMEEPSEEELYLRQCLLELRLRYERDSKPYIDRLVVIETRKPVRFVLNNAAQPMPEPPK